MTVTVVIAISLMEGCHLPRRNGDSGLWQKRFQLSKREGLHKKNANGQVHNLCTTLVRDFPKDS